MVTALLAIVAGSTLVYVLQGSQQESLAVQRSKDWNSALILAEAGIEEGMTFINNGGWPNSTTYSSDGWSKNGNVFSITRVLNNQIGSYTIYVTNSSPVPSVCSIGTAFSRDSSMNSNNITRTVLVKTINTSPFPGALTMQKDVDMNGRNVTVDSYDSSDASKSYWTTNGYGVYTNNGVGFDSRRQANGNVATDGAVLGVISVGNGSIYGKVNTGPGGTTSLGAQGSVGDTSWVPTKGIQPGYSQSDMNVDFPSVSSTNSTWTWLPSSTSSITNSGYYRIYEIHNSINITAPNVVLLVPNGVSLSGSDTFNVGKNSTVTMYVGNEFIISGSGSINLQSQHPSQMIVWGLDSLDTLTLNGNGAFWGAIYAPNAVVNFNGSGNSGGFYGALTAYSIRMNGTSTFSYDESLGHFGATGFTITSWQEVGY